jgi:hypothetical protein
MESMNVRWVRWSRCKVAPGRFFWIAGNLRNRFLFEDYASSLEEAEQAAQDAVKIVRWPGESVRQDPPSYAANRHKEKCRAKLSPEAQANKEGA